MKTYKLDVRASLPKGTPERSVGTVDAIEEATYAELLAAGWTEEKVVECCLRQHAQDLANKLRGAERAKFEPTAKAAAVAARKARIDVLAARVAKGEQVTVEEWRAAAE